jgi:hypothetical protein
MKLMRFATFGTLALALSGCAASLANCPYAATALATRDAVADLAPGCEIIQTANGVATLSCPDGRVGYLVLETAPDPVTN